ELRERFVVGLLGHQACQNLVAALALGGALADALERHLCHRSYSSQPSKKSNTEALNSPCAIIEKWSQPGMVTALAPAMASARPCGGPARGSGAPPVPSPGARIATSGPL